jgi:hypothetical protein
VLSKRIRQSLIMRLSWEIRISRTIPSYFSNFSDVRFLCERKQTHKQTSQINIRHVTYIHANMRKGVCACTNTSGRSRTLSMTSWDSLAINAICRTQNDHVLHERKQTWKWLLKISWFSNHWLTVITRANILFLVLHNHEIWIERNRSLLKGMVVTSILYW